MRHLVTFILRLWVDHDNEPAACEGQVECVASGEQRHVRSQSEAVVFIRDQLGLSPSVNDSTKEKKREDVDSDCENRLR